MKIVGGHDYWDSAAAYGVDKTVTLVRNSNLEKADFSTNEFFFPSIRVATTEKRDKRLNIGTIMCTGAVFPFVYEEIWNGTHWQNAIMYDVSDIIEKYPDMDDHSVWWGSHKEDYLWFCNQPAFQEKAVIDFLCKHNAAFALIFPEEYSHGGWNWRQTNEPIHKKSNVWINPSNLKAWDFFKIKDSFTMFMEVDQWVSGVLPQNKETVILSDKSKIVKAGFDLKTSFRKAKKD
jgi:hypothetical protein